METNSYKLSCYLLGHSEDVRSIALFDNGTIVSTSRDKSAIVWTPNRNGNGYVKKSSLKGHSNFVSSVHVINPSSEYPKGYIITGGHDNLICIYEPDEIDPIYKISAHNGNVCCLNAGINNDTFLSSSWDNTARLWSLKSIYEPLLTLASHNAAVWSVIAVSNEHIVTGSADKLIIVWQNNGTLLHKLSGHTDCVRDFAVINNNEFLSCANDSFIKRWNVKTGQCIDSYKLHSHYIYSIDFDTNNMLGITSGEDYCVKVWQQDKVIETINLPVQSIWCSKLLKNSDIVTGSSDGILRIFTRDPKRYAEEQELKAYDEAVAAQTQMEAIDVNNLTDITTLNQPGKKDGQIIMVKEGNKGVAYSWSASQMKWEKIGDILGQSLPNSQSKTNKQFHNGSAYDYVFSVDIEDGAPPLKLPYNIGQDPWAVAQKFIHDNNLDQMFLEQVANFIVKNSSSTQTSNTSFADPFTGGSRYVPTTSKNTNNTPLNVVPSLPMVSYIPQKNYLKLEQANTSAIFDKLRELNEKLNDITLKIIDRDLDIIRTVITEQANEVHQREIIVIMKKLLEWPRESIFPVLDIARLLVLKNGINNQFCNEDVIKMVGNHIKPDALPANQMLTFRLLANMFLCAKGESYNIQVKDEILNSLLNLTSLGNKHHQIAISTYLLNLVVGLNKQNDKIGRIKVLNVILKLLSRFNDQESTFRILVAIGSLLSVSSEDKNTLIETVQQSETALSILTTISENVNDQTSHKLNDCSEYIIKLIFQNT